MRRSMRSSRASFRSSIRIRPKWLRSTPSIRPDGARRRLEGEVIRDAMLLAAGKLNLEMGGRGVFPPLPPGVSMPGSKYLGWKQESDDAESNRRSVYVFVKRNLRYPMFETFDFPDTHESCPNRYPTVTPTQPT